MPASEKNSAENKRVPAGTPLRFSATAAVIAAAAAIVAAAAAAAAEDDENQNEPEKIVAIAVVVAEHGLILSPRMEFASATSCARKWDACSFL